jgi:hypothetical protein
MLALYFCMLTIQCRILCVYVWGRSNSEREGRGCLLHAEAHRQSAQAALKLGDLDCDAVHDERGRGIQQFQGAATCCGVCATEEVAAPNIQLSASTGG